jgi:hypothetical protein
MGCIYRDAKNIVVWLGPAKDDSDLAMPVLADVGAYLGLPEDSSETQLTSIVALCTRQYWRRAWVQQELHLARQFTVYCGSNAYLYSTTFAGSLYKIVKQVNQRLNHRVSNESHRVSKERLGRNTQLTVLEKWIIRSWPAPPTPFSQRKTYERITPICSESGSQYAFIEIS